MTVQDPNFNPFDPASPIEQLMRRLVGQNPQANSGLGYNAVPEYLRKGLPHVGTVRPQPQPMEPSTPGMNPMQSMMLGLGQKLNQPGFLQQGGMNLYDRANQMDNDADTEFQNAVTQKPKAAMNAGQGNLMLALAALFMLGGAKPGAILNAGQSFMGGLKGRADEDEQRRLDAAKFKYQGAGRKADQTRQKGNMVIGLAQQDLSRRDKMRADLDDQKYAEFVYQRNKADGIAKEERESKNKLELEKLKVTDPAAIREVLFIAEKKDIPVSDAIDIYYSQRIRTKEMTPGDIKGQRLTNEGKVTANAIAKSKLEFMDDEQGEKRKEWERAEAKAKEAKESGDPKAQQVSFAQRRIILSAEADFIRGRIKEIDDAIKAGTATQAKMAPELNGLKARLQNVRNIFTKMTQEATGLNLGQAVKPTPPNLSGLKGPIGFRKGPGGIAVPDIR